MTRSRLIGLGLPALAAGAAAGAAWCATRRPELPGFPGADDPIAERMRVDVDGATITMIVRGRDRSLPVLLLLGGGPGIPGYLMECLRPTGLADDFIVAWPEYRGTGLSRSRRDAAAAMTTDRYLRDVDAIAAALGARFGQDRILLMGHSFGTYLGYLAAQARPDRYLAYVAMSQLADARDMERAAHAEMVAMCRERGDDRLLARLRAYDLDDREQYLAWTTSSDRDQAMHGLGGGTAHDMRDVIAGLFLPSLACRAYTPLERVALWRAKFAAHAYPVTRESREWPGPQRGASLGIPFYVFAGRHDLTTLYARQRSVFDGVDAPVKGFYTFPGSAHSPLFEEPNRAREILRLDVLRGVAQLADA